MRNFFENLLNVFTKNYDKLRNPKTYKNNLLSLPDQNNTHTEAAAAAKKIHCASRSPSLLPPAHSHRRGTSFFRGARLAPVKGSRALRRRTVLAHSRPPYSASSWYGHRVRERERSLQQHSAGCGSRPTKRESIFFSLARDAGFGRYE